MLEACYDSVSILSNWTAGWQVQMNQPGLVRGTVYLRRTVKEGRGTDEGGSDAVEPRQYAKNVVAVRAANTAYYVSVVQRNLDPIERSW